MIKTDSHEITTSTSESIGAHGIKDTNQGRKKQTNKETVSCFDPCSVQNVVNKVGTFEIFSCEKEKKGDKTKTNNKQQNTKYAVDICTNGWLQFISHYLYELSIFQLKIYL